MRRIAVSVVVGSLLAASVPLEASAQLRSVVVESVPTVAPLALPVLSLNEAVLPSASLTAQYAPSLASFSAPVLTVPSLVPSALSVAVKPSLAAASKPALPVSGSPAAPSGTVVVRALTPALISDGAALFDGAISAASAPEGPASGDAVPVGRSPRHREVPRRFTSRLARWTGVAALYSIYRDGVLVQRFAANLEDKSAPTSRRASAARLLGSLGRLEAVPTLAQAHENDPVPRVRRLALEAMLRILDENAASLMRSLKAHPRSGARGQAAATLGWLVGRSESPAALEALEALGVAAMLDRAEDVRLAAITALAGAKSPRALATLEWMRANETRPHMRSAIELALADARRRAATVGLQRYRPPEDDFADARGPLHEVALKRALAVSAVFVAIELVGGFTTGSTALKADATHLAADQLINAAALFSLWMGRRPPNSRKSYGYLKVESVVGLLGAGAIAVMGGEMAVEAWHRVFSGGAPLTWSVAAFALASLASNLFTALILWRHHGDSLSVKGAFLHSLTDAIGSVGVIVSVAAAMLFGLAWVEPVAVALIVVMIARTAWELGRPAWNVLIDAVPDGVDLDRVEADLLSIPGAAGVHDLHVWALNSRTNALTATLFVRPGTDHDQALATAKALLREKHGIARLTVQVETIKTAQ